jgi:hypothetical protein
MRLKRWLFLINDVVKYGGGNQADQTVITEAANDFRNITNGIHTNEWNRGPKHYLEHNSNGKQSYTEFRNLPTHSNNRIDNHHVIIGGWGMLSKSA